MGLLTSQTMNEEILALYQEVLSVPGSLISSRGPLGAVQCSNNMAEETHIKILKALQCRWGPTQLEREIRRETPRTRAQVEFHAKAQATYDYFHHHCRR